MLAAIAHSDSPGAGDGACRWVDTAAVLGGAVDRAAERLDSKVQSELPARFGPVAAIARQLQQDLNTTSRASWPPRCGHKAWIHPRAIPKSSIGSISRFTMTRRHWIGFRGGRILWTGWQR